MAVCGLLVAGSSVVTAGAAAPLSPPAVLISPTTPMVGESFVVAGKLSTALARPIALQHQLGTYWQTIQRITTSSTGQFSFTTSITNASTNFRVSAPKFSFNGVSYSSSTSAPRTVTTVGQTASLSLPFSVAENTTAQATLSFTPVRVGRPVQLQVLRNGAWVTVAAGVQNSSGKAILVVPATAAGSFSYRARTSAAKGAAEKVSAPQPVNVTGDQSWSWARVSAGYSSTCALRTDGTAWCWGSNLDGQLGDGTLVDRSSPVVVTGGRLWSDIASGASHTCAIRTDSTAWCWGRNDYGQLGNGTTTTSKAPVPVSGGETWKSISSGFHHTCGVRTDGSAWCWGWTGLSDAPGDRSTVPVRVGTAVWSDVSAGLNFTCGVRSDRTAWCWGENGYYNVGDGTTVSRAAPVQVSGGGSWIEVEAGEQHACGRRADQSLWCWGLRLFAEDPDNPDDVLTVPTRIGSASWIAVGGRGFHECAVQLDGSAWCWGPGDQGQLGNGTTTPRQLPTQVSGTGTWLAVSGGEGYTCGIKSDKTLWCWGGNYSGQLGLGNAGDTNRLVPTRVK